MVCKCNTISRFRYCTGSLFGQLLQFGLKCMHYLHMLDKCRTSRSWESFCNYSNILRVSYCPAGSCYHSQLSLTFHYSGLIAGYTDYPATEKVLTVVWWSDFINNNNLHFYSPNLYMNMFGYYFVNKKKIHNSVESSTMYKEPTNPICFG